MLACNGFVSLRSGAPFSPSLPPFMLTLSPSPPSLGPFFHTDMGKRGSDPHLSPSLSGCEKPVCLGLPNWQFGWEAKRESLTGASGLGHTVCNNILFGDRLSRLTSAVHFWGKGPSTLEHSHRAVRKVFELQRHDRGLDTTGDIDACYSHTSRLSLDTVRLAARSDVHVMPLQLLRDMYLFHAKPSLSRAEWRAEIPSGIPPIHRRHYRRKYQEKSQVASSFKLA